jgi:DNA-binding transcriptional MerR regulator
MNREDQEKAMTAEELLIHELAERAGISVRTIRYYIDEGLLPQPSYQGKYSYYTLNYVDRLELIRRLKESYLPLREINEIMNSLTDDQVRKRLNELPASSPKFSLEQKPSQPTAKPGAKALDYINQVMDTQTKHRMKGTSDQPQPTITKQREMASQINFNSSEPSPSKEEDEIWQRISLAPGVELNLRRPLDPVTENLVQQVINFARRIFHFNS